MMNFYAKLTFLAFGFLLIDIHSFQQRLFNSRAKFALKLNRNDPQSTKQLYLSQIKKFQSIGLGIIASQIPVPSKQAKADELVLPECSDSIVVFKGPGNKEIVMIGTAHISEESVNLVRRVIQKVKPDKVMIELDKKRLGRIKEGESLESLGFEAPADQIATATSANVDYSSTDAVTRRKPSFLSNVVNSFISAVIGASQKVAGALLGKALSQFYNSIEKLGFTAGGEFKAAVEEARVLEVPVLLGDRDVDVTLQRLASAISAADSDKMLNMVDKLTEVEKEMGINLKNPSGDDADIDKAGLSSFVENMKQKEVINRLMTIVQQEMPAIYDALIGERDRYMANSVANANVKVLVGVVGLAHLQGIERVLKTDKGFNPVNRNCPVV